jgi:hypothetical protein
MVSCPVWLYSVLFRLYVDAILEFKFKLFLALLENLCAESTMPFLFAMFWGRGGNIVNVQMDFRPNQLRSNQDKRGMQL